MKSYNVSISEEVEKRLEVERKRGGYETLPELMHVLLTEAVIRPPKNGTNHQR